VHAARRARCGDGSQLQDPADAGRRSSCSRNSTNAARFTPTAGAASDPDPAWYGYSVGRWEGDAFVIETAGFKEGSWLDNNGHPHTEALRLTERFRRINFGRMDLDVTVDDAKAYSRPWKSDTIHFLLQPDTELLEHLCENNRDADSLQKFWEGQQAAPPTTGKQ
jgi:hypothetical protein